MPRSWACTDTVNALPIFLLLVFKDFVFPFPTMACCLPAGTYEYLLEGFLEPHKLILGSWEGVDKSVPLSQQLAATD